MSNYLRIPPSINRKEGAFKIAGLYLLIGGLWILFSDKLMAAMVSDPALLLMLNTLKGWGYIVVTALLLYWLIQRHISALHLSEDRYATAFRASPSAMAISRLDDGRIFEANDRWQDLLGYSQEELLGQSSFALHILYADPADRRSFVAQIQAQGFVRDFELKFRRKSGEECQVSLSAEMIEINNEVVLLTIITDITERKLAEAKLRESEEWLRLAYDATGLGIWRHDITANMFHFDARGRVHYGFDTADVAVAEVMTHIHPDDLARLQQEIAATVDPASAGRYATEYRAIHPDGTLHWLAVQARVIFEGEDAARHPVLGYGTSQDINARKQVEQALRNSENKFSILFSQASLPVVLSRFPDHEFVDVNDAWAQLFGYTKEELIGKTSAELGINRDTERRKRAIDEVRRHNPVRNLEQTLYSKSGDALTVLTNVNVIEIGGQDYALTSVQDITERKRAENELHQTAAELARSNAELEQFAYVASHDLQEPLRAVAGMLQLLQKRSAGQLDDRSGEFIRHALEGTVRMQVLLTDLLAYSRVGTRGRVFQPIDMTALLGDVLANLRVAIQESGTMITHDPLPTVMADHTQLIQLFQNLIGNAIKFRNQSPPVIHIGSAPQNNRWLFAVCDNGIGLEAQYFERIFGVFQRLHTRQEYPGSGIGLAICKKIVERHDGHIWIESAPGQGSTFYFTLPNGGTHEH